MAHSLDMSPQSPLTTLAPTRALRSSTSLITTHTSISNPSIRHAQHTTKRRKRLDPWYPKRKAKVNPNPRAPPPTHLTCRICVSDLPRASFIRWVGPRLRHRQTLEVPAPCIPHLARDPARRSVDPVCRSCIGAFMAARMDMHGARRVGVGCLEPGCTTVWPWELVMLYFPASRLEEYNIASFEHWRVDSALFTCLAAGCGFTGLVESQTPGYPQVQCGACAVRACAECRTGWHVGQTCAEVRAAAVMTRMSDPEMTTLRLMQAKDGRRCPNCQLVIEKDGGCAYIFCPGCQKTFNWKMAAGAVPGAKKALPTESRQDHWQTPRVIVCEVDGLERTAEQPVLGQYPGAMETCTSMGPLPAEDDPDL